MTLKRSMVKRRVAFQSPNVRVRPMRKDQFHKLYVSTPGGVVKGCPVRVLREGAVESQECDFTRIFCACQTESLRVKKSDPQTQYVHSQRHCDTLYES